MRETGKTKLRRTIAACILSSLVLVLLSPSAFPRVIDGVAIIVNKDAILVSQINETLMPLVQEYRARYAGDELKKKMDELRNTIIDQAIDTKLVLQVARARGITADENAVDARVEIVKSRFPSEDDFFQALAARGITYREYRDEVAEQLLVQETIRRVVGADIRVSDNEIEEYYKTKIDEFVTQPKVNLAQIFFTIPSGSAPEEVGRIRRKAEQVRTLIDDGIEFSKLAEQYSEGPYQSRGGVIGIVGADDILPELEQIAFNLKTGEVSPVIQTGYGFHILKALEAVPARKVSFEEAKPVIEERIREQKRSEKYKEWIKKLREDAYIEVKI